MIHASLALALVAAVAAPSPVPIVVPTSDPLAYDDAGLHFRAPDGWTRVNVPETTEGSGGKTPPAAVFVRDAGKVEQRTIVIDIEPFDGTLDGYERSRETELHSEADGTFVDYHTKTMLANGMPAYFLQVSQPGAAAGHQVRRYDYLVYDLTRSIDIAYIGRYGDFDSSEVKTALASLAVVVYPRRR